MRKYNVNVGQFFSKLQDSDKQRFKAFFCKAVKSYAPDYSESKDAEEIQLSDVWRYMDGNFEFFSKNDKVSLEELASSMANEVKDQIINIA